MRVAVLGGGRSSEHEVSLESAKAVATGLEEGGHEVVGVTIDRDGRWSHEGSAVALEPGGGLLGCEVVFPALHGPYGEDGVVQGLLDALDVPYCGAGVAASALSMDKVLFKDLLSVHGVAQVPYVALRAGDDPAGVAGLGLPVFVKPARLGSSVGISKVSGADELPAALAAAFEHDPLVIVEAMSHGMEVECSVTGNDRPEVSLPGEIELDADWYDYEAKYTAGGMRLIVPARLPDDVAERVRATAAEIYRLVDCAGMARCDFFVEDPHGDARVLINELNTIPGFTATSVFAKLWEATGVAYPELLDRLLGLALERHDRRRSYSF
ncbi:MAG TPA: D-alanine--D-alanine ligase family protein [Thermoleophilaceae bacterium]|nr:D-alanine--D-alanine ligase family protein [Thermoleophilaceae bacterium]